MALLRFRSSVQGEVINAALMLSLLERAKENPRPSDCGFQD